MAIAKKERTISFVTRPGVTLYPCAIKKPNKVAIDAHIACLFTIFQIPPLKNPIDWESKPHFFYMLNGEIGLFPTPKQAYKVVVSG